MRNHVYYLKDNYFMNIV